MTMARYRWLDAAVTMAICAGWCCAALAILTAVLAVLDWLRGSR